ncbi:MAG: lipoprotein [Burkholderiales bacterium]|nr:lipoprotein [Burkholderiales bacterium]
MTMRTLILSFAVACLLSACGQKGPLTLPSKPESQSTLKTH